jgi:hypothetical protein
MPIAKYTLDEFIHDMTDLVAAQPDQASLSRPRVAADRAAGARDRRRCPSSTGGPPRAGGGRGGSYLPHRGRGCR